MPIISPYVFSWGVWNKTSAINTFTDLLTKTSLKAGTYGFLIANASGKPDHSEIVSYADDFKTFIAGGGALTISFGGANGTMLEKVMTADAIVTEIKYLVSTYGASGFDWDIEGSNAADSALIAKAAAVCATLRKDLPALRLSITIAADASGISSTIPKAFKKAGVTPDFVNIMTMDYYTGTNGSAPAISAAKAACATLKTVFGFSSDAEAYAHLSICPMIGTNDDKTVFSPTHMKEVLDFVNANGLYGITYWAANRDTAKPSSVTYEDINNYSGFDSLAFADVFASSSSSSPSSPSTSTPVTIPTLTPTILTPLTPSATTPSTTSGFITVKNKKLVNADGSKFAAVGFNAYWLGAMEDYSEPTPAQMDEMFSLAKTIGATTIRSHTLGVSSGHKTLIVRKTTGAITKGNLDVIDLAISKADAAGIKLIVPLTDAYNYYHGNYGDFCTALKKDKSVFFTDTNVRVFFKQFLSYYLNHVNKYTGRALKDEPAILCWELGNELGNLREAATSTALPTKKWALDIVSYIKSVDPNHLVMCPSDECLGSSTSQDFDVPYDIYGAHFYYDDESRMTNGIKNAHALGKPYIVGEYTSKATQKFLDNMIERGVDGDFVWSVYPHDANGKIVAHNDGFTLHYPEDKSKFDMIASHIAKF